LPSGKGKTKKQKRPLPHLKQISLPRRGDKRGEKSQGKERGGGGTIHIRFPNGNLRPPLKGKMEESNHRPPRMGEKRPANISCSVVVISKRKK